MKYGADETMNVKLKIIYLVDDLLEPQLSTSSDVIESLLQ